MCAGVVTIFARFGRAEGQGSGFVVSDDGVILTSAHVITNAGEAESADETKGANEVFVEFRDGSILAQLSPPDMRLPIQYALTYPDRLNGPARRLNWRQLTAWHFEQPDHATFPSVQLGYEVARRGGTCGASSGHAKRPLAPTVRGGRTPPTTPRTPTTTWPAGRR